MARSLTVQDVARYFLALQDPEAGEDISNLKLQKLCYYAQGFSLALLGQPLFPDRIKAWEHGPVIPALWHEYKQSDGRSIPRVTDLDVDLYDQPVRDLLDEVYEVYGQFSAWKLRQMTHAEPPWKDTPKDGEITRAALSAYFSTRIH
jgi:uncharacterized phage-associated protein